MGQWGQVGQYNGMRVMPHLYTGEHPFHPIEPISVIDGIFVLNALSKGDVVANPALEKVFVGMTYSEYQHFLPEVCPICKERLRKGVACMTTWSAGRRSGGDVPGDKPPTV